MSTSCSAVPLALRALSSNRPGAVTCSSVSICAAAANCVFSNAAAAGGSAAGGGGGTRSGGGLLSVAGALATGALAAGAFAAGAGFGGANSASRLPYCITRQAALAGASGSLPQAALRAFTQATWSWRTSAARVGSRVSASENAAASARSCSSSAGLAQIVRSRGVAAARQSMPSARAGTASAVATSAVSERSRNAFGMLILGG